MDEKYEYPRETVERVYLQELSVQGAEPPGLVEYTLTRGFGRPLDWAPLSFDILDQRWYFTLSGLDDPGEYQVWVRVIIPDTLQSVVVEVGRIRLT